MHPSNCHDGKLLEHIGDTKSQQVSMLSAKYVAWQHYLWRRLGPWIHGSMARHAGRMRGHGAVGRWVAHHGLWRMAVMRHAVPIPCTVALINCRYKAAQ